MKKILFFFLMLAIMLPVKLKAQDLIDFETQDFSQMEALGSVTNSTTYPWTVVTPTSTFAGFNGSFCMKSGNAGVGSSESSIELTVTYLFDGSISFLGGCWGEGTTTVYDKCLFYIDGVQQFQNGSLQSWDTYTYPVLAGTHTFKWSYTKDGSVNPTGDAFLVDDIIIEGITTISCPRPETLAVSDITAHEASLVWTDESASGNYVVQCKKASQSWDDEDIFTENTSNTELELTDLEGNTTYNVRVASVCGSETSLWRYTDFHTECAAITSIPVIWDFENYNIAGSTDYPLAACWNRVGNNYPYVDDYEYYAHNGTHCLASNYNPVNNIAILPEIDYEQLPLNTLQLRFFAKVYYSDFDGMIEVGLLPDATDANSFITVGTISTDDDLTDTYSEYEVSFANYEGELESPYPHIALRLNGGADSYYSSQYIYIDDMILENAPSCNRPTSVGVNNVTTTSTDVIITDPDEADNYRLYIFGGDEPDSMDVNSNIVPLTGLTPNTTYTVSVATICEDGSLTRTTNFTFNTMCESYSSDDLPYTEDFDSYTDVPGSIDTPDNYPDVTLPECWTFLNRSLDPNLYPQTFLTSSSFYALSGNCLFFNSSMNTPLYAALPMFEENIRDLMVSFSYRNESISESNGILSVGYMTNPYDASTFVETYSCPQTSDLTRVEQLFSIVPDDVEDAYIAFRYSGGESNNYYLSLDSVVVNLIPDCTHPAAVSVSNITNNSAELVITDPDEVNNYHVIIKKDTTTISETDVQSVNYTIGNLEPNTAYLVTVATNCEDGTVTPTISATFATLCDYLTTLPQSWNFDTLNTGGTSDYPLPACWSRNDYVCPYTYTATSGSYYNYAYSGSTCLYSYGNNKILVLPPIDNTLIPVNIMQMSFFARCYSYYSTSSGTIEVGVMTDPLVDSTFVPLASIEPTSTYQPYEILLNTAPADAAYIALRISTDNTIHIDDLSLDSIPSCVRPSAIIANNVTTNSADISIVDPNEAMNYLLFVDNGTTIDTIELQDTTFTLTELSSATSYTVSVATVCDNGTVTNTSTSSFQTSCELITADMLPKTWNLEANNLGGTATYPLPACWNRNSTMYPYVDSDDYNYGYSHSGTKFMYMYCTNPSTYYLFLPEIDVDDIDLNTLQLRFFAKLGDEDNNATIEFGVLPNPSNVSSFIPVSSTSISTEYDEYELSLTGFEGEGTESQLALRINLNGYYDEDGDYYYSAYLYMDDIVLEPVSSCPRPANFTVTGTTQTGVSLTWDDSETSESWNVVYGPAGFNPGTTEDVFVAVADENIITIEELTPGTMYDFYVQTNCGGDEVSGWRGPVTVTPGSYNMPKNGTDTITTCEQVIYDDGGATGNYSNNCNSYLVINPETEGSFIHVSGTYYIETGTSSRWDYLQIFDGTEATGTPLFDSHLQGNQGNINVVSASGPITLYFYSDDVTNYDGFELNVSCVTCAPPAFTVAATSATEAVVTITSNTDSWDLVYGETGFNPEEGTVVENLTNTTYTVSDLEASTSYDFYVRTNCEDGESDWAGPILISTPCLSIIVTNDDPFVEDFNSLTSGIPMCWDNSEGTTTVDSYKWSYYNSGESGACVRFESYLNTLANTNMLKTPFLDLTALSTPTLRFSYKNPAGGDLSVYLSTDGGTTYTSAIAVGLTNVSDWTDAEYTLPVLGNASSVVIVFRGISNYGTGSQISCSIYLDNVYVGNGDTVGPGPQPVECNAPTNVTVSEITHNSAVIEWTQEGTPESWTVSYKKADAQTWTATNVTAHPYTITDLDAETAYNVKVTANCDDTTTAESTTVDFTTDPDGVNEYVNSTVIYPNPTTGQFTISNTQCVIERVEVMDVYGKLLNTVEVNDNTAVIDVTNYASGVYFTRIHTDKGMVVKQIVKK